MRTVHGEKCEICATCVYFNLPPDATGEDGWGLCICRPPQMPEGTKRVDAVQSFRGLWPAVRYCDLCGSHRKSEPEPVPESIPTPALRQTVDLSALTVWEQMALIRVDEIKKCWVNPASIKRFWQVYDHYYPQSGTALDFWRHLHFNDFKKWTNIGEVAVADALRTFNLFCSKRGLSVPVEDVEKQLLDDLLGRIIQTEACEG
jgi:hypothetical protein